MSISGLFIIHNLSAKPPESAGIKEIEIARQKSKRSPDYIGGGGGILEILSFRA